MEYYTAIKKQMTAPCKSTDESYRCDAERKKPDKKEDRVYDPIDVKS